MKGRADRGGTHGRGSTPDIVRRQALAIAAALLLAAIILLAVVEVVRIVDNWCWACG